MSATTVPIYHEKAPASPLATPTAAPHASCPTHGVPITPQIDSLLQTPTAQSHLLSLSKALSDLAETGCTRCATETLLRISTTVMADVQKQKKSGAWTKEQKKALKLEAKLFKAYLKPLKREMKEGLRAGM